MSSKPLPTSDKALPSNQPDTVRSAGGSFKNFLIGFVLSGLPIFVCVSLSMEMTHAAQISSVKLAGAMAVPLLCGALAVIYQQRFTDAIAAIFESIHLPF